MKVENLAKFNYWDVIYDDKGSSYSYINKITESIMYIDKETKKNVLGLNMFLDQSDDSSYCRMTIEHKNTINLAKTSGLKISYKSNSSCPIRIYIKQFGQEDNEPMFYYDLDPQKDWGTVIIRKEHFISPHKSSINKIDWKKITGFQIEPQTLNGKENEILIREFIIMNYEFNFFRTLPYCLNYKSSHTKLLNCLKLVLDSILFYAQKPFNKALKHDNINFYGTHEQRMKLWDDEYSRGKWDYLLDSAHAESESTEEESNPSETDLLFKKYFTNAHTLDLGCGLGSYVKLFEAFKCRKYLGLDISSCAIEKAKQLYKSSNYIQFQAADIFSFTPDEAYDLIFMSEILYYFDDDGIKRIIEKYCNALTAEGVICVRIWSVEFYKSIVDIIMSEFSVVDYIHYDSPYDDKVTKGVMLFLKR